MKNLSAHDAKARFGQLLDAAQHGPVEIRDVQIAGIVAARKAPLATRNVRHFDATGIELIDRRIHPISAGPSTRAGAFACAERRYLA